MSVTTVCDPRMQNAIQHTPDRRDVQFNKKSFHIFNVSDVRDLSGPKKGRQHVVHHVAFTESKDRGLPASNVSPRREGIEATSEIDGRIRLRICLYDLRSQSADKRPAYFTPILYVDPLTTTGLGPPDQNVVRIRFCFWLFNNITRFNHYCFNWHITGHFPLLLSAFSVTAHGINRV